MKKVLLDTDAASRLLGERDDVRRHAVLLRLRRDVTRRRVVVVLSDTLLSELSGLASKDCLRFRRIGRELRRLSTGSIMHFCGERIPMEAKRSDFLRCHALFYPKREACRLWDNFLARRGTEELASEVQRQKRRAEDSMRQGGLDVVRRMQDAHGETISERHLKKRIVRLTRDWFDGDGHAPIREWCSEYIADGAFGIQKRLRHRKPENLPSLWNYVAFQLANIRMLHAENRSPRDPMHFDAFCYADGAYADLLVTDDRRFRETAQLLRGNDPECISVEEFTVRYLGSAWP